MVLNDISYIFESDKIYGIVGSNGCGKVCFLNWFQVDETKFREYKDWKCVNASKNAAMPIDVGILIEHPGFT